jgi:carboxypeptidase family protein
VAGRICFVTCAAVDSSISVDMMSVAEFPTCGSETTVAGGCGWRVRHLTRVAATLFVLAPIGVGAQTQRLVKGVVVDSTGTPLSAARIQIVGTSVGVVSNDDGWFLLRLNVADTAHVRILKIGYDPVTLRIDSLEAQLRLKQEIVLTVRPPERERPRPPQHPPNIFDDTIPDRRISIITRAIGLPLLPTGRRESRREIRLTLNVGLGAPDRQLVLRNDGRRVRGALWFAWSPYRDLDLAHLDTGFIANFARTNECEEPGWSSEALTMQGRQAVQVTLACRPVLRKAPNWNDLWRRLDSLGVWTLPDDAELSWSGIVVTDGACVVLETLDGQRYRSVQHCVGALAASPEQSRADAVAAVMLDRSLLELKKPRRSKAR